MTDVTLQQITSGYNVSKLNTNFSRLATAVNNEVVHTTGGNNVMQQDLDMNGHTLLNIDGDFIKENGLITGQDVLDAVTDHEQKADPHPQYATDVSVGQAIESHKAEVDPHPQYLTSEEGLANPMTTFGDIIFGGTGGDAQRLGIGAPGKVLKSIGGVPTWADETAGGLSDAPLDGGLYSRQSGSWAALGSAASRNVTGSGNVLGADIVVQKDSSTGSAIIPAGTTAQRPVSPANGYIRFNTSLNIYEGFIGSDWVNLSSQGVPDYLNSQRIDVASASNVNLNSLAPNTRHINITGNVTINSFTINAGSCYFVRFASNPTLVESASIVTNSGASITVSAGDTMVIRATSNNVVEVLFYRRVPQFVNGAEVVLSGTSTDITGIPANVSQIDIPVYRLSLTSGDLPILLLGTAGSFLTTGYSGGSGGGGETVSTTSVLLSRSNGASDTWSGTVRMSRVGSSNKWAIAGSLFGVGSNNSRTTNASIDLGAPLTRLRFTSSGTASFDDGSVSINYLIGN